jgi:hypothetical protein
MSSKPSFCSHWFGFLFLLPFLLMLCIHEVLGLSDQLLGVRVGEQDDPVASLFNLVMMIAFFLGVVCYIAHAIALVNRGTHWLLVKIALLALYWGGVAWWLASRRRGG